MFVDVVDVVGVLMALSWCLRRILMGSPGFGNVLGGSVESLAVFQWCLGGIEGACVRIQLAI